MEGACHELQLAAVRGVWAGEEVIIEYNGPPKVRCVFALTLRMLLIGMSVKVPAGAAGAAAGAGAARAAAGGGAGATACQWK